MLDKEIEIINFINEYVGPADYFNMTTEVSYVEDEDTIELEAIKAKMREEAIGEEEKEMISDVELKDSIQAKLKATNQKRVEGVKYNVILFDNNGEPVGGKSIDIKEIDLLFGT